jgi:hypothetical protein
LKNGSARTIRIFIIFNLFDNPPATRRVIFWGERGVIRQRTTGQETRNKLVMTDFHRAGGRSVYAAKNYFTGFACPTNPSALRCG